MKGACALIDCPLIVGGLIGLLLLTSAAGQTTYADEASDAAWGTDAAREALNEKDYPWYDEQTDDLHSIEIVPAVVPREASDWDLNLPDVNLQGPNLNWNIDIWEIVQWVVWGLMIGLLVGALIYFVRSVIRDGGFSLRGANPSRSEPIASEPEQIENLPFPVERPKTDLLGEATHAYKSGDFGRAIVYLFGYQLVHLDKHHLIMLAKGKTNRQYLRELGSSRGSVRDILQTSMVAFENVFFGNHPLDQQDFEDCWQRLDDFHQDVQRLIPSMAK